ncbi:hypothetical protein TNCT_635711 [Trichonephila clavata]|uniref:Uncharacterized protein n=1 Tax=Trichonephila clavata TaxID=2740835 RepID=A0A8X6KXG5_TRICU|nr:hypothetical protein TNCT_635711 [Trichonephila clavata]
MLQIVAQTGPLLRKTQWWLGPFLRAVFFPITNFREREGSPTKRIKDPLEINEKRFQRKPNDISERCEALRSARLDDTSERCEELRSARLDDTSEHCVAVRSARPETMKGYETRNAKEISGSQN